jgi:hypothetical protein
MLLDMARTSALTCWTLTRTSGVDMNPTLVSQRANQFATKTVGFDSTVLLLRREQATMRGYLITSGTGGDSMRAATDLAHTVGAKASESPLPMNLDLDNVIGYLVYESGSAVAREAQVNADPTETARLLANTLPDGSWVAVTLRKPTKKERTRSQQWLSHRLSTAIPNHHSLSPDAVVVSIFAGAEDPETVRSILEATRSAMPGFDVITKTKVATRMSSAMPFAVGACGSVVAAIGSLFVPSLPDLAGPDMLTPFLGAGLAAAAIAGGRFAGFLPSMWKTTQHAAADANFPAPPKRRGRPKSPQKETKNGEKIVEARDGDYPLAPSVFHVGPQVVVGVVAPHAGAESGEMSTKQRAVPPVMLQRIGPLIGDTEQGPAFLPATDAFGGTAVIGKAGSGKSLFVRSLFGWSCLDRIQPSNLPGFPGARNALIAFESKGDGALEYKKWADATGDITVIIDIANPATYGIDLFAVPGTPKDKANFFVNALKYAFGDGAIGDRSFETLLSLLPAALMVTPDVAKDVPDLSPHGSPLYYLHVLLGGRSDETGIALANELRAAAMRQGADPMLNEVCVGMAYMYAPKVTPSQRRTLQEAPRNKIAQLLLLESWWSPTRPKVTWQQILENHRSVVINTGTSLDGRMVEDELNEQISAILMFSLRHAIQRICSGWQEQNRSVSIFADELSLLAGSSEAVIAWLKDQGRSFGVRPFLATQRPEQLPDKVRSAFMNFSTIVSFTQEDMKTAREIADAVSSGEEGDWTAADVLQLDTYAAIVRAHVGKKRQPAFTIRARNFEGNRTSFIAEQGYVISGRIDETSLPPMTALENPASPTVYPAYIPEPGQVIQHPVLADPITAPPMTPVAPDAHIEGPGLMDWAGE